MVLYICISCLDDESSNQAFCLILFELNSRLPYYSISLYTHLLNKAVCYHVAPVVLYCS